MSSYLDEMTHKKSETFEVIDAQEGADDFIGGWLLDHAADRDKWRRQVRVTIQFVPTPEESQQAADDEYFDEEYS